MDGTGRMRVLRVCCRSLLGWSDGEDVEGTAMGERDPGEHGEASSSRAVMYTNRILRILGVL